MENHDDPRFREWAAKVSSIVRRINEKVNLTRQQVNHTDGRIEKVENTLIRHDQRLDRLQNEIVKIEANESSAKQLDSQLQYFKIKALLIKKTPGGVWTWLIIDAVPAIIVSVLIMEFIHIYGYHTLVKRILDFILFR